MPVPSEVILRVEELTTDPQDSMGQMIMTEEDDEAEQDNIEERDRVDERQDVSHHENSGEAEALVEEPHLMPTEPEQEHEIIEHGEENQEEAPLDVSMTDDRVVTSYESNRNPGQGRYNLHSKRQRDYSYCFTLLSLKAGNKRRGKKAKEAMMDELKLLLSKEVFAQLKNPTREQMETALRIHCFVVEKRDGRIKARAIVGGRTQSRYYEEETYSPTVKLESIMLSSLIDAYERRDVVTIDIKGAFLKAKVPDDMELVMKMERVLAELMCELNPDFKMDENGVLYLQCKKALYGHIEAA